MSAISLKSITGITSITTPAGVDNQLTLHSNNTVERLRISSDGKVGINITDNTTDLHVRNSVSVGDASFKMGGSNSNASGLQINYSNSSNTSTIIKQNYRATSASALMEFDSGYFTFKTGTGGDERLRITSGGNVGIGTDDPLQRLHVKQGSTTTPAMVEALGAKSHIKFQHNGGPNYTTTIGSKTLGSGNVGLTFDTGHLGAVQRMTIDVNGNVGIGTELPTSKFHIHHPSTSTTQILECSNGSVELALKHTNGYGSVNTYYQGTATWRIGQTGQFNDFSVWQASGVGSGQTPYRFAIKNSGNVGISTYEPREILHVNKNSGTACILVSSSTAPQIRFNPNATDGTDGDRSILGQATGNSQFVNSAVSGDTILRGTSSGNIKFGIGTDEKVRITSSGNLEIINNNDYLKIGAGGALAMVHTGGQSYITNAAGHLTGRSASYTWENVDGSAEYFRISSDGNIGINDTGPPNFTGYKSLSIHGSTGGALVFGDDGTDEWEVYGGDGVFKIYDRAATTTRLHLTNSYGQFGINTSSFSDTATALSLRNGRSDADHTILDIICNDNQTCRLTFSEDSNSSKGSIRYYYTGDANYMSFYTNGGASSNEAIRINSNGAVNIGGEYTNTTHKFLVDNGTAYFKSRVYVRGSLALMSTPFGANVTYDTGISVNASGYGGSILALCSRNYGAGTNTQAALYFIKFHYDGNNTPGVYYITGTNNFATFGQSASNTLTVAMGASNNMFTVIESSVS
jgi:hypothetical protein